MRVPLMTSVALSLSRRTICPRRASVSPSAAGCVRFVPALLIQELCAYESQLNRETARRSHFARAKPEAYRSIQERCSEVSGTAVPRALAISTTALPGSFPRVTKRHAAIIPDRPTPWRQCMTAFFSEASSASSSSRTGATCDGEGGTCRSGIGNDRNLNPSRFASRDSATRSRSCSSSAVSKDNTVFMPVYFQSRISSSSHSPPRGRAAIASFPGHGPSIQ